MDKTWLSILLIMVMIFIFIEINFSSMFLQLFESDQSESFRDYHDGNTQIMNSFVDPRLNDPVLLLNDPTTSTLQNGDEQAFNEKNYFIGIEPSEFITPKLVKDGLSLPSNLSQPELNILCKSLDNDQCVSSSFCALVGDGKTYPKCLPGNSKGPYVVFSDINVDYYYYQNRCYGNCPGYYYAPNKNPRITPKNTYSPVKLPSNTSSSSYTVIPASSPTTTHRP